MEERSDAKSGSSMVGCGVTASIILGLPGVGLIINGVTSFLDMRRADPPLPPDFKWWAIGSLVVGILWVTGVILYIRSGLKRRPPSEDSPTPP